MRMCDARHCRDEFGVVGMVTNVGPNGGKYSAPVGACSDDGLFEVWHGMDTPAYACGRHAHDTRDGVWPHVTAYPVFVGHRCRLEKES